MNLYFKLYLYCKKKKIFYLHLVTCEKRLNAGVPVLWHKTITVREKGGSNSNPIVVGAEQRGEDNTHNHRVELS